ncbi:hypothetical protein EV644_109129 [Kribbella orskensis]|uniref:Lipoprotein n=1 Tax=Kribbella orskensis TaxID=2512216 RepID=A0ABY2BH10_9ACTN|nr:MULTISPECIES: hypothetical protein [Kribbella]TCN38362.1 hypothetical protein EV642_109147 [Kribbella sp. VKM Ac-2500]TCO20108.1 hypothetical protein EV644_109129 [Kribbella orskensis]
MRVGSRRRASALAAAVAVGLLPVVSGCQVGPAPPGPAEIRSGPPPWDAPRDAVSYIEKAGFERLPLDFSGPAPYTVKVAVTVDGNAIQIPAGIGVDRVRAEQAAIHTHATDGVVYVEAKTKAERPTLKQFFELWGVRYDGKCLGDACSSVTVRVNGQPAAWDTKLSRESLIQVEATG